MDDNVKLIESLLESTIKYGVAEIELVKLKTLNKTSDVVSSLIPHAVVFFILGNNFYGFFIIAAFYAIVGLVMHFFMHKWIKRKICNYLVKQMFK